MSSAASLKPLPFVAGFPRPRLGFWGRVSDPKLQDPSLSIPRQRQVTEPLADQLGGTIEKHYWDIESGRKDLEKRGNGADGSLFSVSVPRDGGLKELLADAAAGLIDGVVVESIDRVARTSGASIAVEDQLKRLGILIYACDEPIGDGPTHLLNRRIKQAISEFYVGDLLAKSRHGMETSAMQGWHSGGPPPYGYALESHPHPNPHKRAGGAVKHRRIIDPIQAPIVHQIFEWYCIDGLGLRAILDRLNADLDSFPPPTRNKKDENDLRQTWSRSQIQAMLRNPVYTGYAFWNRHDKRKGQPFIKPRGEWQVSPEPTHPAIVTRELFDMVEAQAAASDNRNKPAGARKRLGATSSSGERFYVFRGMVFCATCSRRLTGTNQKGHAYRCQFTDGRGDEAAASAGHPRSFQVRESAIQEVVMSFLERRVFGPERLRLLHDDLARHLLDDDATSKAQADIKQLEAKLTEITVAVKRCTHYLEKYDPGDPVAVAAEERIDALAGERKIAEGQLSVLRARPKHERLRPSEIEATLAAIPDLRPALDSYSPVELRGLLEAFKIAVTVDKLAGTMMVTACLVGDGAEDDGAAGLGTISETFPWNQ